jgi:pimeloyl-ACP methyl ester carboxylesterase
MNPYADDLATLGEALDQDNAIHVGHSTGGGEVARYIRRHGTKRVAKAVLIGRVPPLIRKTTANPGGVPMEAFDQIYTAVLADCSQSFNDLGVPFYGANKPGTKISQGVRDSIWPPRECWPDTKTSTIASKHSPRRTSQKTSRSSARNPHSARRRRPDRCRSVHRPCLVQDR